MRRTANIVNELNKFVYLRRAHAAKPLTSLCDRVHLYSKLQFLIAFTIKTKIAKETPCICRGFSCILSNAVT